MKQNIFLGLEIELAGFEKQPSSLALSDVLSQLESALPAGVVELRGRSAADFVRAELWLIDEILPVLRFSRNTEVDIREVPSSHAEIQAELRRWLAEDESTPTISFYSLFPVIADYFKPLNAAFERWNTDDLLTGEHSPASDPGVIGTSAYYASDANPNGAMEQLLRCGIVAAGNVLARDAAAWADGPVGAEERDFDMWHARGTLLVRSAGQLTVASRCLRPDEADLRKLSMDVISLVPSLQQTLRQDRIHGLVQKEKTRADAEKEALKQQQIEEERRELQQRIEEERREIEANIVKTRQSLEAAKQKIIDRRGQGFVAVGSIAAFMLTIVALLPAFGALKGEDIQALVGVAGDAWGATLLGVGLAFLVFLVGALVIRSRYEKELADEREKLDKKIEEHKNDLGKLSTSVQVQTPGNSAGQDVAAPEQSAPDDQSARTVHAAADQSSAERNPSKPSMHGRRTKQGAKTSAAVEARASKSPNSEVKPEYAVATRVDPQVQPDEQIPVASAGPVYQIRVNVGALARGRRSGNAFDVDAGSYARVENQGSITDLTRRLRAELVEQGVLVRLDGKATYQFTSSYRFESMSAAAAVVLGRGVSGDDEWTERKTSGPPAALEPDPLQLDETAPPKAASNLVPVALTVLRSGVRARGMYNAQDRRLTVLAGSMASPTTRDTLSDLSQTLRREALRSGALQRDSEGRLLQFQKDMTFDHPRQAAEIVVGYGLGGYQNWKVEETGESLDTLGTFPNKPENHNGVQAPPAHQLTLVGPEGVEAKGTRKEDGELLVLAGARARLVEVKSIPPQVSKKRAELIAGGHLVDTGDAYELKADYSFPNPSIAAGVFLGRSANGHSAWKNGNQTLGQLLNG